MAVRTGGPGPGGLSLLVVPLKAEGVDMRKIRVQGPATSGTTYIELDQVKVPVENLIGKEGMGMNYVMVSSASSLARKRLPNSLADKLQSRKTDHRCRCVHASTCRPILRLRVRPEA